MTFSIMAALGAENKQSPDVPEIKLLDVNDLVADKNNFYRVSADKDIEKQNELLKADVLERGIQNPISVIQIENGKFKIISGHRRCEICSRLVNEGHEKFKLIPAIIRNNIDKSDSQDIKNVENEIDLIMSNATARELNDWEKIQQASRLNDLYQELKKAGKKIPGRINELVAQKLNISKTQVGRYKKIDKNLSNDYKKELQKGNIAVSTADALASKPQEEQEKIYKANPVPKLDDIEQKNVPTDVENNNQPAEQWNKAIDYPDKLIYCAHKYRADNSTTRDMNKIHAAEKVAKCIIGYPNLCFINPIEAVSWMAYELLGRKSAVESEKIAMRHCLTLLSKCDELWILSERSEGVNIEISFAKAHGIPVFDYNKGYATND
ncbi:ParB N-terminal domain-containing protein [Pectinatus frisingensis]|uniref:DUF7768 domain-containing protein n=1 Tax=Pectinatus frisingensis TaxID=865 RepID=UPI0018C574C7|nr:ParB N-terminal domain-containing protein [Pectinatus frisingensis]